MNDREYDQVICKICQGTYEYLGSHVWHAHHLTSRAYKGRFGLDYNLSLMSNKVLLKKQIAFNNDREKYLAQGLINIKEHQFKPNDKRLPQRISKSRMQQLIAKINDVNQAQDQGICPFIECGLAFKRLDSHIYNAHGYVKVKTV
jgi:hypothetical protein